MMINAFQDIRQDTIKVTNTALNDTISVKTDSASHVRIHLAVDSVRHLPKPVRNSLEIVQTDTTSVCMRNNIADITFHDSVNVFATLDPSLINRFPFTFIEKNQIRETEAKAILVKHLKTGQILPEKPFSADWTILIILIAAFLYSLISTTSKNLIPEVSKFILFRGINDSSSRDIGGMFHWQSAILSLVSFFAFSLFSYCAADIYNLIPTGTNSFIIWLIFTAIIVAAVLLRHIACIITGIISDKSDMFREYLYGVYQSYWVGALALYIFVIMILYTNMFSPRESVITGLAVVGIIYLIRILRLLIIFMNRNISIFYLILYLCALEILPVVISVKYFTGLV
jgi:hypothetical protein